MIKIHLNQLIILVLISSHIQAQNCESSRVDTYFHLNNAETILGLSGSIWNFKYQIPNENIPLNEQPDLIYAGNVWLGGLDQGNNLHLAAGTYGFYSSSEVDFYPGPINAEGSTDSISCANFNHHFRVTKDQIDQFKADYSANGVVDANHPHIFRWPARGNPIFSSFYGFELPDQDLAPFIDHNSDGVFNPYDGDHPAIKGDEAVWWVYNDVGNIHAETGGEPVGAEIQIMAYAFDSEQDDIDNTTFYDIKIIAKGDTPLNDFYTSFFVDGTIGCYTDDRVGVIPEENLAFTYNSDAVDGTNGCNCDAGENSFCEEIPIVGIKLLQGSHSREALSFGFSGFSYFNNRGVDPNPPLPTTDPQTAQEYYNYMRGLWKDGTPLTNEGTGYNPGTASANPANFAFSGNPANATRWTMCSEDLEINRDRRMLLRQGPFTFQNGDVINMTYAVLYVPDVPHPCPDVSPLIEAGWEAQEVFDQVTSAKEPKHEVQAVELYPNPMKDFGRLTLKDQGDQIKDLSIFNAEGMKLRQYNSVFKNIFELPTSNLPRGIYFYQIETKRGAWYADKFIIQ